MVVIHTWHKHTWHLEKIFKAKLPSTRQWLQGNLLPYAQSVSQEQYRERSTTQHPHLQSLQRNSHFFFILPHLSYAWFQIPALSCTRSPLACLHSNSQPSPPTKFVLSFIWHILLLLLLLLTHILIHSRMSALACGC